MGRLEDLGKSLAGSNRIIFGTLFDFLNFPVVLAWPWMFVLIKNGNSFEVFSTDTEGFALLWTFLEITWFLIFVRRRAEVWWKNAWLFAKTNRCRSFAEHRRQLIHQIAGIWKDVLGLLMQRFTRVPRKRETSLGARMVKLRFAGGTQGRVL